MAGPGFARIPLGSGQSWDDPLDVSLTRRELWLITLACLNAGQAALDSLDILSPDEQTHTRHTVAEWAKLGQRMANLVDPTGRPVQWVDDES